MRKIISLIILIVFTLIDSYSQGRNNLWLYGYAYPNNIQGKVDFSNGNSLVDTLPRKMQITAASANITDTLGNLLFYTNGCYIANALDDTLLNGSGLNPSTCTDDYCQYGIPIVQADLILPSIGPDNIYYLFHESCNYSITGAHPTTLYYSIIDMDLDSGRGEVISKNNVIVNDTLAFGAITSVKHANGRDWWIVVPNYYYNVYHILLLTPQGIIQNSTQQIGTIDDPAYWPWQATFSKDGNTYAKFMSHHGIDLMKFDRCSGVFFDYIQLEANDTAGSGGISFSPNGRFLYVSAHPYLYQFDLWAVDIQSSRLLIGTYDGYYSPPNCAGCLTTFYLCYLAPDSKIYIISTFSTHEIHVINQPDSLGLSCDLQQHSFDLLTFNGGTVPNYTNYFLGSLDGNCDSLQTAVHPGIVNKLFKIYPSPSSGLYTIQTSETIESIEIFDFTGALLFSQKAAEQIDLRSRAEGIYFYSVTLTSGNVLSGKLFKN